MIEGIFRIGNLSKKKRKVSQIATNIPNLKDDYKYKIGKINFNLKEQLIEFDFLEEYEEGKEEDYRFIQMKLSGRQNQFFCTFKELKRLVGDKYKKTDSGKPYAVWLSIENELKKLSNQTNNKAIKDNIEKFLTKLETVKNIFYKDYLVDASKIKDFREKDISKLRKFIKNMFGNKEDIIFYTILVNGEKIVEKDFYDELIKKKIIDDKIKKGNISCSMCNKQVHYYFDDFARLPVKFFVNDKIGFSQNLSSKWEGNFVLCEECYLSLFAGEKFLLNSFTDRIGAVNFLIVPEFLDEIPVNYEKLKKWSELTKDIFNPFKFFDENALKKKLEEYKKYGYTRFFSLNYIFYEQNNQQFKIFTIIKDIPDERLDYIRETYYNYMKEIREKFPWLENVRLKNLEEIYWLIPLRYSKADRKIIDIPKITELFDSILSNHPINKNFLIREFWLGAKAKYFKNQSYQIVSSAHNETQLDTDKKLMEYILKTHQLLALLRKLKLINGGKIMELDGIPEEFMEYLKKVNFNEKQTALFLLGTLIGDIGSKQSKYRSKPILNKINFQGMSFNRILVLSNEVYEKLKQEKLLQYTEKELIYEKAKELFDKNLNNWNLKPHENVYFLLSGYAFKTKLNIEKGA